MVYIEKRTSHVEGFSYHLKNIYLKSLFKIKSFFSLKLFCDLCILKYYLMTRSTLKSS